MAEQDSTTKTPEKSERLDNLLSRALWPLDGFVKELGRLSDTGSDEFDSALCFLIPLMDCVQTNLKIIGDVLEQSLGMIRVETSHTLRLFGAYQRDDFGKAFIEPDQAAAQGGE